MKNKKRVFFWFLYGAGTALLIFLLKYFEYRFFIRSVSTEMFIFILAAIFSASGIWLGLKIQPSKNKLPTQPNEEFVVNEQAIQQLGISKREQEVLSLMSAGLSNQEIASRLFISLSTVKTHTASLFVKLDAQRRTMAVKKAKELKIIP